LRSSKFFKEYEARVFRIPSGERIFSAMPKQTTDFGMTQDNNTAVADMIASMQAHEKLDTWLKGKGLDGALKAMNFSAGGKKPGRVVKRVSKALGDLFTAPRVIAWEKGKKNVYAASMSAGNVKSVVMEGDYAAPDEAAVFQTDLYFRANKEVTEVNASTVAGITQSAFSKLNGMREDDVEVTMRVALTLARIFQTGLKDSDLSMDKPHRFLVPNKGDAMVVLTLPIERIEFDERLLGQVALISDIIPAEDISEKDREELDELQVALTRDGHPGAEAFGQMITARAHPLEVEAQ
jgi:hypothetical protein